MHPALFYGLLISLGFLPSIAWLVYFYRKDCHPEPKSLIAKTFLMGIILSPLAIVFQKLFQRGDVITYSIQFLLWAAFVEEAVKFYAVRIVALHDVAFDEPVDAMVYMISAALGFAAMENILVMFQVIPEKAAPIVASVWLLRFGGATLLHALSSALVGYFLALAWFSIAHKRQLIITGLIVATVFHAGFNATLTFVSESTSEYAGLVGLGMTALLLVVMAFLVTILFDKIKERQSVGITRLA